MCCTTVVPRVLAPCIRRGITWFCTGEGSLDRCRGSAVASSRPSSLQDLLVNTCGRRTQCQVTPGTIAWSNFNMIKTYQHKSYWQSIEVYHDIITSFAPLSPLPTHLDGQLNEVL